MCLNDGKKGQIGGANVVWDAGHDGNAGGTAQPAYGFRGTLPSATVYAVPEFIWGMSAYGFTRMRGGGSVDACVPLSRAKRNRLVEQQESASTTPDASFFLRRRRNISSFGWLNALLKTWPLILVVGTWVMLFPRLIPSMSSDRGIFVSVAERLLAGDRLYAQVFDNKEPLFYYLVAAQRALGPVGEGLAEALVATRAQRLPEAVALGEVFNADDGGHFGEKQTEKNLKI